VRLDPQDNNVLAGADGQGAALAMRILVETARLLGAPELTDISSAHIDGCLYHGESGVLFAEKLVADGAKVRVFTTLNVGALDLVHRGRERMSPETRDLARRMMSAYVAMGCKPTWTCAPYQAGHRPAAGQDVAWGESNAVVFCNSVLGARTNRYGDFLDICAAVTGRAPKTGLHVPSQRLATILVDTTQVPSAFFGQDIAYPIVGAWLGGEVGSDIAAFTGLGRPTEDQLKALGAAAASSGSVGLFHIIGVTPEAADQTTAFGGLTPKRTIQLNMELLQQARASLSTVKLPAGSAIDAVAIGSPHLSAAELRRVNLLLKDRRCRVPLYACTGRHALAEVIGDGVDSSLAERGVTLIADTCIVVTPILPSNGGVLVTNSGKFAHYTPANTGYDVVLANLEECVDSAVAGSLQLRSPG
jgi:predicted aconitase